MKRISSKAVVLITAADVGLAACGTAASQGQSVTPVNSGDIETTVFSVNGKPLTCIIIRSGLGNTATEVMSCDWVGYHAETS